jgi:hypothetical protein
MAMDTLRDVVTKAGFEEISWVDKTAAAMEWFADQKAARRSAALGIHVVMGPGFPEMAANLERNLTEGRARLVQAIVRHLTRVQPAPRKGAAMVMPGGPRKKGCGSACMSSEKRASAPYRLCSRFVHTEHRAINCQLGETTDHASRRMPSITPTATP